MWREMMNVLERNNTDYTDMIRDMIERPLFNTQAAHDDEPMPIQDTVNRLIFTQKLAHWLNTDEATALDWLIFKIGAFRGMTDSDVRRMITGEE
jgi:hypothetical protein